MLRSLLLAACTLMLAGCVTVSNTLAPEQIGAFKLTKVDVVYAPDAVVTWGDGQAAYAAHRGVAHDPFAAATPDSIAYERDAIGAKIRASMERKLAPQLAGNRPVRVLVTVRNVSIASPLQRVLIGGGQHGMSGDVEVLDAKTGAVLSTYPKLSGSSVAGSGMIQTVIEDAAFDRPIDRIVDDYTTRYQRWLLRS
jgi:hypothetical protein